MSGFSLIICALLVTLTGGVNGDLLNAHVFDGSHNQASGSVPIGSFKSVPVGSGALKVLLNTTSGSYVVLVEGREWLRSAPTFFTANQRRFNTSSGDVNLIGSYQDSGVDSVDSWSSVVLRYELKLSEQKTAEVRTEFKTYDHWPNVVLFGQHFISGLENSSIDTESDLSSGFPSFYVDSSSQLGFLAYGGIMFGDTEKTFGRWSASGVEKFESGLDSGPLVLFDGRGGSVVISAFSSFMASSSAVSERESGRPVVSWGVLGSASTIPKDFSLWTVISHSSHGVNQAALKIPKGTEIWNLFQITCRFQKSRHPPFLDGASVFEAMQSWGHLLRTKYKRGTEYRDSELTNNYLGYYTDNGAYYYYLTEKGHSYSDTILMVKDYSTKQKIPFRYIQYDSWFYPKGVQYGVTEWVAMSEIFPRGMQYVWNQTGWVSVAHNRWWEDKTVYAKENGGKYDFILEHKSVKKALPVDSQFWVDLLSESRKWGLTVYEQDWLNLQFNTMKTVISSVEIGHKWLMLMGEGARKSGVNIQYCMAPSRVALTSLLVPNVVQSEGLLRDLATIKQDTNSQSNTSSGQAGKNIMGRVSEDYQPGNDQWKIGVSSMFAHALGVAPFKDNFWSTTEQPGNIYNLTEPNPELQAAVSTLSAGPVAPGDKIGYANVELIMRSCNTDGLLLKPSRPATAVDLQIYKRAEGSFLGEVWTTYSEISGLVFGIVLAADFKESDVFTLYPHQTGFAHQEGPVITWPWFGPGLEAAQPFTSSDPLVLKGCYLNPFCLYVTSPVILVGSNEVILAGELNKWVPISPRRVTNIELNQAELTITLEGASSETVNFTYVLNKKVEQISCQLSIEGRAQLLVLTKTCLS